MENEWKARDANWQAMEAQHRRMEDIDGHLVRAESEKKKNGKSKGISVSTRIAIVMIMGLNGANVFLSSLTNPDRQPTTQSMLMLIAAIGVSGVIVLIDMAKKDEHR